MKYKCCFCENFLTPQGPIQAFVGIKGGDFAALAKTRIQLDESLKITNLNKIQRNFTDEESAKAIEIQFQKPIEGHLGNFMIKKYTLRSSVASIEIQCDHCKHNCQYRT